MRGQRNYVNNNIPHPISRLQIIKTAFNALQIHGTNNWDNKCLPYKNRLRNRGEVAANQKPRKIYEYSMD